MEGLSPLRFRWSLPPARRPSAETKQVVLLVPILCRSAKDFVDKGLIGSQQRDGNALLRGRSTSSRMGSDLRARDRPHGSALRSMRSDKGPTKKRVLQMAALRRPIKARRGRMLKHETEEQRRWGGCSAQADGVLFSLEAPWSGVPLNGTMVGKEARGGQGACRAHAEACS